MGTTTSKSGRKKNSTNSLIDSVSDYFDANLDLLTELARGPTLVARRLADKLEESNDEEDGDGRDDSDAIAELRRQVKKLTRIIEDMAGREGRDANVQAP